MDKTLIAVVAGVVIIIIGFVIYAGMDDDTTNVTVTSTSTPATSSTSAQIEAERQRVETAKREQEQKEEAQTVAYTIDVTKLPEAQQTSLKTMGMNDTSIDITNAMVACAEADISESRMIEIKDGATVTASEGIKLVSCYNAN